MRTYHIYLFLISLITVLTAASCRHKKKDNTSKETIYIIGNESERGQHGEGTYINTNSSYQDKDGNTWHRDNIFAPKPNESLNDDAYQKRMGIGNYAPETNQYNKGYDEGYKRGYNEAQTEFE